MKNLTAKLFMTGVSLVYLSCACAPSLKLVDLENQFEKKGKGMRSVKKKIKNLQRKMQR